MMTYTFIIIYPYNSSLISNFRKSSSIIINHQSFTLQYLNSSGFQQLQPFSAQCGVSPRMSFGNSSAARGSGAGHVQNALDFVLVVFLQDLDVEEIEGTGKAWDVEMGMGQNPGT